MHNLKVATALTVYGIETMAVWLWLAKILKVATALTVYGIETCRIFALRPGAEYAVATALTVYGIETQQQ